MTSLTDTLLNLTQSPKVLPTYTQELWQAKASRNLKQKTAQILAHFKLTSIEWSVLGLLYEAQTEQKAQDLSHALGVEAPFVTVVLQKLAERRLILKKITKHDRRSQQIQLSAAGKKLIPKIEAQLQAASQELFTSLEAKDLSHYFKVLRHIAELP